jgi:acyl-coenzyme A thioesterase PaaI-like protein
MSQLSDQLEAALSAVAGEGRAVEPVSFTIDYGAPAKDAEPRFSARVDRATRSLVFASAEAVLPDGRTAANASAVFRVAQS